MVSSLVISAYSTMAKQARHSLLRAALADMTGGMLAAASRRKPQQISYLFVCITAVQMLLG